MKELYVSVKSPTHKWHIWFFPIHELMLKYPNCFFANARTERKQKWSKKWKKI